MTAKKATPAPGTKDTEIQMLREIFSLDGYLADSLNADDQERMIYNIYQDFPIFMLTRLDLESRISRLQGVNIGLQSEIDAMKPLYESRGRQIECLQSDLDGMKEIKRGIILQAIKSDSLYLVEDFTTENEVLRIKLENNLELTEKERKALLQRL